MDPMQVEPQEPQTETPVPVDNLPIVSNAVMVTFFNGKHVVRTVVAHVLSIGVLDTERVTDDGLPAITVAFPDPEADPSVLSSANWFRGYKREAGVVHYSHKLAAEGKASVVWGHPQSGLPIPPLPRPTADAENPIFKRHVPSEPTSISPGQKRLNEEQPLSVEEAAKNYKVALENVTSS